MEPRVLDGDARSEGQRSDKCLVLSCELGPANLVGQIEIAVDLVSDLDRHPQERGHRRIVERETEALGVGADIGQAQRVGIGDEKPEHPESFGAGSDALLLLGVETHGDELGQGRPFVVQDADRPVPSPRSSIALPR
jgi:hypothetical protein